MQIEQLKKIFEFLEARENKYSIVWKAINGLPFTKEQLKIKGNLDLQGMDVKKLPNGLHVTGNLLLNLLVFYLVNFVLTRWFNKR